jgi:Abnormal spindle-like microcephaly-assoc'd, ASPM-SPD-2-Hydin
VNFPLVSVGLTGQGTAPGLQASPSALDFGSVPDGTTASQTVLLSNDSGTSETVSATHAPGSPFTAKLPGTGTVLSPGQVLSVPVTFHPVSAVTSMSSFSVSTGSSVVTVQLSGSGVTAVSDLAAPSGVSFGLVPVGTRASRTIVISNNGNLPASVTTASGPFVPFGPQAVVAAGQPLAPGSHLSLPVTFTPASRGSVTRTFTMTYRDAAGSHSLRVQVSGTGTAPASGRVAVPPPGGGWMLNGGAHLHARTLAMVSGVHPAGSAVYPMPQPGGQLSVHFTTQLGGKSGMTLALLPAGSAGPRSLGGRGGQLGFGGLRGVAVVLQTGRFPRQPSGNLVGVATSSPSTGLHFVRYTRAVPNLASGAHRIGVTVADRTVRVYVDGNQVLSVVLPAGVIPASALVAFTGARLATTGTPVVSRASMVSGAGRFPAPGGGWSVNGATGMAGSSVELTRAAASLAGSAVDPVPVPTAGLDVTFTTRIYGGSGGNGLTFALLNPAHTTAASLGTPGAGNGFGGLDGVAVALGTNRTFNVTNWAALWAGTAGSTTRVLLERARAIVPLRVGPHTVHVQVTHSGGYVVSVWIDGVLDLRAAAPELTSTSVLAFTASTGTLTDAHLVRDIAITAS